MNSLNRDRVSATQRVTIPIYGFSCAGSGALAVERALTQVQGVVRVYVNAFTEMAYVEYEPAVTSVDHLAEAIEHVGLRAGDAVPVR